MFSVDAACEADAVAIEQLLDLAFGLGRKTKTSYRLREGSTAIAGLSLVARDAQHGVVGTISFWPLKIGAAGVDALLLGPLAVHPDKQGEGVGLRLMREGLAAAKARGHRLVILVGDQPYYGKLGFKQVADGQLIMPGPVDAKRLLALELEAGAVAEAQGLVLPAHRFSAALAVPQAAQQDEQGGQAQQSREQRDFGNGAHPIGAVLLQPEPA
jgi:predicted N-acetyltransferase YhbS